MTTQDKGAVGTHIIEVDVSDMSQPLAAEIARLRKENGVLVDALKLANDNIGAYRWALVDLARYAARPVVMFEVGRPVFLRATGDECKRAFQVLGWPNPCPKDQAT